MAPTSNAVDLAALDARLSRIESTLERLTGWMDQVPAFTSTAADSLDAFAKDQGDLDQRVNATLALVDRITAPETAQALDRVLSVSSGLAEVAEYAAGAPAVAAIAVDSADEIARQLAESGADAGQRLEALTALLLRLTAPETADALSKLLHSDHVQRFLSMDFQRFFDLLDSESFKALVESDILSPQAVEVVTASASALQQAGSAQPAPVSAFGAFRSLSDPDVQRAVGFGIALARAFGQALDGNPALPTTR